MGKAALAVERMSDRQLWDRLRLNIHVLRDIMLDPKPDQTARWKGDESLEIVDQLRLRGTQGRLWG